MRKKPSGGRGQFDWSLYDREVALIQDAVLKYVPFLLMGPKYAAPQWWLDSPAHRGLRCAGRAALRSA
jgi:hypothetical protein